MALNHKCTIFFVFIIIYLVKSQRDTNRIYDFKHNLMLSKYQQSTIPTITTTSTIPPIPPIPSKVDPNPCIYHSHIFNFSNVGLQKIGRDFIKSNDIVSLILNKNNISDISPFAFRKMHNLKYLDLSGNRIPKEKLFLLAGNLNLHTLIIDNNRDLHEPIADTLKEYEVLQNLKSLHLCNSQLRNFQVHFYMATPILTHLYLSNNSIDSSDAIFDNIPATLTHLQLNKNSIDRVKHGKLSHLQELIMDDNVITQVCFEECQDRSISLKGAVEMQYLSLARNLISEISSEAFSDMSRLMILDLSGNKIADVAKGTFNKTMMISELSLADNILAIVPSDVCAILRLKKLNLSGNRISTVLSDTFCIHLRTLMHLDLSNNVITTIENRAFRSLGNLKYLNLSGNRLRQLPGHWVNSYIQELHLERNNFTELNNISLININALRNIYLDENPMPILKVESFQSLPGHLRVHLKNMRVKDKCENDDDEDDKNEDYEEINDNNSLEGKSWN